MKQSVCCAVGLLADGSLTVAEKRREWLGRKKLWFLVVPSVGVMPVGGCPGLR